MDNNKLPKGIITNIVNFFLNSHFAIILIIISICLGIASIIITPKEEEPQIIVPMADIFVSAPGSNPMEIEKLVATPLERLLWQIDGVEYVYSVSRQNLAIVTVRFFVGEDREKSLIKLYNKINMNVDKVPKIVKSWVVKPVEIDDVPIVTISLYSDKYHDYKLRRIGEEVLARLSEVKNTSRVEIIGGRKREIRVEMDPERMKGLSISFDDIKNALAGADASTVAGHFSRFNKEFLVTSDSFLSSKDDVLNLMIGVYNFRPVYIRDVAKVIDGPQKANSYSRIGFSKFHKDNQKISKNIFSFDSVTLAIAKKKGTNAVKVSQDIINKLDSLKKTIIPDDVNIEITRDYGKTAQSKVNNLITSLVFAIFSVVLLLIFTLGIKESLVVALAVPISFSLALFVNYLFGFTINRVTLFALILSLGLVVDDPITNVDNIQRHILKGKYTTKIATLFAVNEVLPPVILSTIAIIICFIPLFFITGMMGPYMAPMAINVPLTVIFSTISALTIVPWFSHVLLKKVKPKLKDNNKEAKNGYILTLYKKTLLIFLDSKKNRYLLAGLVVVLLIISASLALFRFVPLKLLPFDNKNEFQIVIDMPEGTTLETTDKVVRSFEDYLHNEQEVTNFTSYIGNSSPIDFNGLVRHYYLRKGSNVADIRVNLLDKSKRSTKSHEIVLKLRQDLEKIAKAHNANIKIVEIPPGPPVIATIVCEIYSVPDKSYQELINKAGHVKKILAEEPFLVDIDDSTETPYEKIDFVVDKEKASLHGVATQRILDTLKTAISGFSPASIHLPTERNQLRINMILPQSKRSSVLELLQIPIKTQDKNMIPLAELVKIKKTYTSQPIYHKNLERVVYVFGEMAGRAPAEAVLDIKSKINNMKQFNKSKGIFLNWTGEGEWKITVRVFKDMGIAFAAALIGLYILLIIETGSFFMPFLIMLAIPLTLIGIMPGFFILNLILNEKIAIFSNPVFFTATSMIGMIALGGIVIRNSLVLIDFINNEIKNGTHFKEAVLKSGAIRMRPIVLTAITTAIGAFPITFDPVFSGLAWALIFGILASTFFTLLIIPVTYYSLILKKKFT